MALSCHEKQADVAEQVHLAEQINSAVSNLIAYRAETQSADTALRAAAALSLQKIALSAPEDAEHILRILMSQIATSNSKPLSRVTNWCGIHYDRSQTIRHLAGTGELPRTDIQQLLSSTKIIIEGSGYAVATAPENKTETHNIDLSGFDLEAMSLAGMRLMDCKFKCSSLKAMDFYNCFIINGHFEDADLSAANLDNATIHGTFDKCRFWNTRMEGTTFMECSFDKAAFFGCDFSKLKFASERAKQQFKDAIQASYGYTTAEWPDGIEEPSHWLKFEGLETGLQRAIGKVGQMPSKILMDHYFDWLASHK
ncbi:pentapeptide repeat-containing protein [Celeribacter sp.]|uniref:pentapeptide repeat-containing protein n=1 Tax=Celeribacter sp. TaxID=1890673 RepID=UPI003A90D1D5